MAGWPRSPGHRTPWRGGLLPPSFPPTPPGFFPLLLLFMSVSLLQVRGSLGMNVLSALAASAGTAFLLMDFGVTSWVCCQTPPEWEYSEDVRATSGGGGRQEGVTGEAPGSWAGAELVSPDSPAGWRSGAWGESPGEAAGRPQDRRQVAGLQLQLCPVGLWDLGKLWSLRPFPPVPWSAGLALTGGVVPRPQAGALWLC